MGEPPSDPGATVHRAKSQSSNRHIHFRECCRFPDDPNAWTLGSLTGDNNELLDGLRWCQFCHGTEEPVHSPPSKAFRALSRAGPDDLPTND